MLLLRRLLASTALLTALLLPSSVLLAAEQAQPGASPLHFLGEYSFPSRSLEVEGTTVGGLSGIAYDRARGVYYVVSDDRGEFQAPRFYTLSIDLGLNGIRSVQVIGVTTLDSDAFTPGIQPYERNATDLEDFVLLPDDTLLIASERDREGRPWIRHFALDGSLLGELPVAERYVPATERDEQGRDVQVRGVRTNLGFESLALAPDGPLYTANEEALAQDGPIATLEAGTNVRVLRYALEPAPRAMGEWVYATQPIFTAPVPPTEFADNGVSAMLWVGHLLPEYDLLVMERSFATGVGVDVNIYGVKLVGAQDVTSLEALPYPFTGRMLQKTHLVNIGALGVAADNLEGMTLGPILPDGRLSLLMMSDDNFSAFEPPQVNQFLLFALDVVRGK